MAETTVAGALADTSKLSDFEGHSVRQVGVEIPGAAGGLRDAMRVDPQQFSQGTTVYVVLECPVQKVRYEPIDKDEPGGDQRRVHILGTTGAAIVDRELVEGALAEQKRRIESAKEAAAGIGHLPYDDEAEKAHDQGLHAAGLVPGCPKCDEEAQAAAAEAKDVPGVDDEEAPPAPTPIAGRAKRTAKRTSKS